MKKICIYCRTAQDDKSKLDLQIENLKDFAKEKSLEVIKIISETGSGNNLERKGLSGIMEVAKSKQADMILTRDISRISRNNSFNLDFIENLKQHTEFKTVEGFDISKNEWNSMLKILKEFCKKTEQKEIAC